jgi:hypothetical protein
MGSRKVWLIAGAALVVLVAGVAILSAPSLFGPKPPQVAMNAPGFLEEATVAGIDHTYDGDWTFFVGGGVAVFDCSADGRPDLYFAGGSEPAALYRNESQPGGELQFSQVPSLATDLTEVAGAYPLDVDGDAVTDLVVLRLGENVVLRGLGDCRFERANEIWGIEGGEEWTAAFSAKWESGAALPTLAFGNYLAVDKDNGQTGTCSDSSLIRPDGDGPDYAPPLPLTPGWCTLSILFSDWDRSGRRDLRVANDKHYYRDGEEQLWRVADGEVPRLYSREEGWKKMQIWGMGIASFDLTGDGLPEVLLTSQGDNKLQSLTEGSTQPSYTDIAIRRGVTAHKPFTGDQVYPSTAWHPEFQDVNNDGFIDLFISKGNVEAMPDYAAEDPNNLLLGQPDGTFVEAAETAGILSFGRTRGAALADFNLDGMLDLVEVNRRENVKLWRNVGWGEASEPLPMGGWIGIQLEQAGSNRDAIGAWIEVKIADYTIEREVTLGGGHAGGQLGWIHFGLSEANRAEVRVQWPDGEIGPWLEVEANRFWIIQRDASEARLWEPTQE